MNLRNELSGKIKLVLIVGMLLLSAAWVVFANPDPIAVPTNGVVTTNSSHRGMGTPMAVDLIAGNITEVNITADSITQSWAGIVGNVSATLVLDDSALKTLYDWTAASPTGEVYAANVSNILWTSGNIKCIGLAANATLLNKAFGISAGDADNVSKTFSDSTSHNAFSAGANAFNIGDCAAVQLNNETQTRSSNWQEILLYDNTRKVPVYTSLIKQNTLGYNNERYDFEMIVLENGHAGNAAVTNYYFYLELA